MIHLPLISGLHFLNSIRELRKQQQIMKILSILSKIIKIPLLKKPLKMSFLTSGIISTRRAEDIDNSLKTELIKESDLNSKEVA